MNKRLEYVLRSIIFISLLLTVFSVTNRVLADKTDKFSLAPIYDLPKNSVDVLLIGTSHINCSIQPMQLWEEYGITAFNCGIDDQSIPATYYTLKEMLKIQSPKVVVLEIWCVFRNGKVNNGREERTHWFTDNVPLSYDVHLAIQDLIGSEIDKTEFYLPLYSYHSRWQELKQVDFENNMRAFARGADQPNRLQSFADGFNDYKEVITPPEVSLEYIDKIIDLCRENGIALVFMRAPYVSGNALERYGMQNYVYQIAEVNNIPYLDYFRLPEGNIIDIYNDMQDAGHLNGFGQEKMTMHLGGWLKKNYNLPDHRQEKQYAFWWNDLADYKHYHNTVKLQIVGDNLAYFDLNQYCSYLQNEGYIVVISMDGSNDFAQMQLLSDILGFNYDVSTSEKYFATIIEDCKVVWQQASDEGINNTCMVDNYEFAVGNGKYHGKTWSVYVDGDAIETEEGKINIVVWDKVRKEVVSTLSI